MDSFCRGVARILIVAVTSFKVSQKMVTEEEWNIMYDSAQKCGQNCSLSS